MDSHREEKKYDEVDFDSAIEDFGEETVQFCVASFLEKTYKELKANIPKLYKTQNYKEIRGKMHILKTNSGYMGAANFSALCKEFETSCKFESLNEEKIDELYPIFMTNLDKLYSKLKKLNKERFEAPQEPEPEPVSENQNQKEQEKKPEEKKENTENVENKETSQNKDNSDNKEKQEDKNEIKENKENQENNLVKENDKKIDNNTSNEIKENKNNQENDVKVENKEIKENNEKKENKIDNNENKVLENENVLNKNKNEVIENNNPNANADNKQQLNSNEIMEENIEEEIGGSLIELKNCPKESGKDVTLKKLVSTSNKDLSVINTYNSNVEKNNTNKINFLLPGTPSAMKKINTARNFSFSNLSSSNIHELRNVRNSKEGKIDTFRGNPRYEKIVRSFEMAKEENKRKKESKVSMSPKHTVETEKNKVLNRVKLGFSTMDRNEIRDCLKRYDIAVLKNSATLVNDNLNKFLNDVFPTIINDLNIYLLECDLSKKKEIIEKVNIIISNMKYLSDNYNVFFFRINEKLDICKDNEKFKVILNQLIQKLYLLEEELTIIDKVKIKKDDTFLKKMGYFQDNTYTKTSMKGIDTIYNNIRNKEKNNNEQIEGLKKNLGVKNGKIKEQKNSIKKLKHFPSFKDQKLFMIEDKKQAYSSFKTAISNDSSKFVIKSDKTMINRFEEELQKYNELFRESINNKNKEQLIQVISDFENNIVKKYGFSNLEPVMEKWVTKIKKGDSFDELNANIEDIEEVFNLMKQELSNKNLEVINHEEEESQNDDNFYDEDQDNKNEEDPIEKEDMALYSQLRQFNAGSFFQPKNQGLSQHKFKLKVEKIIRETNGNSNEIVKNNQNSNYNLVEKISNHIVLSQNFRTKKNKLIGYSYPFKEDTFLNNCYIF